MSRNNDVFQVLVPTVATPAVAGTTLAALATGAIGAYSYNTNLAINPGAAATEDFYFAVKILNLDGVADIRKSAGTHIQIKNVVNHTNKVYTAPVDMVTTNIMPIITCGDEVGVKVEIRNQQAYRLNGYNQVVKNYMVPTSECTDCDTDCFDSNCLAVALSLVNLINADPDAVVTATLGTIGAPDCAVADVANAYSLVLTVKAAVLKDWCNINLGYFFPHQTQIIVTPINGFNDTVETVAMVFEDGAGYDIKQLEYEAGGWNGNPGPYRVSELVGTALGDFQFFAQVGTNYDVQQIQHDQDSVSGWRKDSHFERTIIAGETGAIGTAMAAMVAALLP